MADNDATKQIIVLGASYAGLGITHNILRHIVPSLPNPATYHVTLIDPSTNWFQRVGAPLAIISESLLPLSKVMLPIADGFSNYPKESFSLVQARATNLNPAARTLTLTKPDGSTTSLIYHTLVISTGAASPSPLLGSQGAHTISEEAITAFRAHLSSVKSIVIAGGGPAGVETAGELGHHLNGSAGWFSSRPSTIKTKITLVTNAKKLLPVLNESRALKAEKQLNSVGVDVLYGSAVVGTTPPRAGRLDSTGSLGDLLSPAKIELSNGEILDADLYIPATGLIPNTDWLPKDLVVANGPTRGKVITDKTTLRVTNAGERVYAVGEVADYGPGGIFDLLAALPVVVTNVKRDLLHDAKLEKGDKAQTGKDRLYANTVGETQVVPVGRAKGVGAFKGWGVPSFFVWLIKGRDYLSWMYPSVVKGDPWKKEDKWKDL